MFKPIFLPASQECRQYKVLVKDAEENRNEDWVSKALECVDDSSSSSSEANQKQDKVPCISPCWAVRFGER